MQKGKLEGKVAVVTGGAQGIGAAIASAFLGEGAIVYVGDIGRLSPMSASQQFAVERGQLRYVELDVTHQESVDAFIKRVTARGTIDILVNNAGIARDKTLLKMTPELFDQVLKVNLYGVFNMTKAVVPIMVAQKSGVILNASSVVAKEGNFGQTAYVASKCAVEGMTKTWARELVRKGIRVNAVAPGFTTTPMTEGLEAVAEKIPLERFATPEEIAAMYLFLASNDASYITGEVFPVNGGLRL